MHSTISRLDLSTEQLIDIAEGLDVRISEGLEKDDQEIKCLPAFIPADSLPHSGRALVLDLGGTRLRAAIVSVEGDRWRLISEPLVQNLPVRRNIPLDRSVFLDVQADLLARLAPDPGLPLGYCFSFPARPLPDGDCELITWTKEICVPGVEGKPVGSMLADALAAKHGIRLSSFAVINDTAASLLAGFSTEKEYDAYIGLIVGTGVNMAALMEVGMIPKLESYPNQKIHLPVNLESGNFHPPHLTQWDDLLDRNADLPGFQRFEKAVSGAYLGRLMKTLCPDAPVEPAKGAADLVKLIDGRRGESHEYSKIAGRVLERSAELTAASLAGLIKRLNAFIPRKRICIMAEGGLMTHVPRYRKRVSDTLEQLLPAMKLPGIAPQIVMKEHANLIGSAAAALSLMNRNGKTDHEKTQGH